MKNLWRQCVAGLVILLALTVVCGLAYPAVVWAVGQIAFSHQANGSPLVAADGEVAGSALIGQQFEEEQWFHSRPTAVGYGGDVSGPSNWGPNSTDLAAAIDTRRREVAQEEGVEPSLVPPDAVTASASGLDPHISPAYAELQVARVARTNGLTQEQVRAQVAAATNGRDMGFLGEPRVNVLRLNLSIAALSHGAAGDTP